MLGNKETEAGREMVAVIREFIVGIVVVTIRRW